MPSGGYHHAPAAPVGCSASLDGSRTAGRWPQWSGTDGVREYGGEDRSGDEWDVRAIAVSEEQRDHPADREATADDGETRATPRPLVRERREDHLVKRAYDERRDHQKDVPEAYGAQHVAERRIAPHLWCPRWREAPHEHAAAHEPERQGDA